MFYIRHTMMILCEGDSIIWAMVNHTNAPEPRALCLNPHTLPCNTSYETLCSKKTVGHHVKSACKRLYMSY